jgi:hypothetical protein
MHKIRGLHDECGKKTDKIALNLVKNFLKSGL